jgi:hypothetical protein
VIAPARLERGGEIGLRATPGGFGTPPLPDGTTIAVRGAELVVGDRAAPITTLRAAAELVGVELRPDPDVGSDLPPFEPDAPLGVDDAAARAVGDWYALGDTVLARIDRAVGGHGSVSPATLWPEHFDLALIVGLGGVQANVGFSPGDSYVDEPYVYVGPFDREGLDDPYWNASFGAVRTRPELAGAADPAAAADAFVAEGLGRLRR